MAGSLKIECPPIVAINTPFACTVYVTAARVNDTVTVRLVQTTGVAPLFRDKQVVPTDHNGNAIAIFDEISLDGPCDAQLQADAPVSAVPLAKAHADVEVVP